MKLLQNMKKKDNNKGFSLVELIIVIAIMAILVGIVGTQVIPYLNKSRQSKDLQLLNSYSTAAVTAYSSNAELVTATTGKTTVKVYGTNAADPEKTLAAEIITNTGYATIGDLQDKMSSSAGKAITEVEVVYDWEKKTVTVTGIGAEDIGTVTSQL